MNNRPAIYPLFAFALILTSEVDIVNAQLWQYDRNGASTYSSNWCGTKRNTAYWDWDDHGESDCANFASQVAQHGGFDICETKIGPIVNPIYGGTIQRARDFKKFLDIWGIGRVNNNICVDAGDFVVLRSPSGVFHHVQAIRRIQYIGGIKHVFIDSHDRPRCDRDIATLQGNDDLYYYHILPTYRYYSTWGDGSFGYYHWLYGWQYVNWDPLTAMGVNPNSNTEEFRGFAQFPVSAMPSNAYIVNAFIRLAPNSVQGQQNPSILDVNRIDDITVPPAPEACRGGTVYVTDYRCETDHHLFCDFDYYHTFVQLPSEALTEILNRNNGNPNHMFGTGFSSDNYWPNPNTLIYFWNTGTGVVTTDVELRVTVDNCDYPKSGGPQGTLEKPTLKSTFEIELAAPTPFTANTKISYKLPKGGDVFLKIYNIKGAVIRTYIAPSQEAGSHIFVWDGITDNGKKASGGVYFCRLEALGTQKVVRAVLVR